MKFLELVKQRGDVLIALCIVSILGVMLLPLHPLILDLLLSISIALSVVILVTSVYILKPLDFSVFPSLLLVTTLFRLSLNIASTRLILLRGNEGTAAAGHVIMAFGNFVVGGNYAVGFIIFLILVVVNFVVITKGAGRIAEVAARFTLDAMPGKQMAIDADLNTGLIDETEARRRRSVIAQESDFYGAMDGASKFVRGDAIAGLVITGINIIGGLVIGVVQYGMALKDAASTYTILTIGEGLVAQIPALLVSTAAGLVVSRAGKETDLGKDITSQVLVNPKVLLTTSAILTVLGLVPGLPHVPFLVIAAAAGGLGYIFAKTPAEVAPSEKELAAPKEEPKIESFVEFDPLTLEIGYGLIPLVEEGRGELLAKVKAMRRQLASEIGFIVPPIHIKDNLQLRPHEYSFSIRGIEIVRNEIMMGHLLAVAAGPAGAIAGIPTKEPSFGLPAYWITETEAEKAQVEGYMVVDPANVIATHLTELVKKHCSELLTRTEVQNLLDSVSKSYPKLIDELIPVHLSLGGVQRVLQNLLRERVPINDLVTILETLVDYAPMTKDIEILTEHVRQALSRFITKQYVTRDGSIPVMTLDPKFERVVYQTVENGEAISPETVNRLLKGIEKILSNDRLKGIQPIILCSPQIRRYLKKLMEKFLPSVVVLSNAEISSAARIYTLGMVRYED
ncbi:MAG: flagellar biosynthesis protein FlhA [Nitrospiraceae bacterium]|nr:flagellar biosynthesis protein FlhA [Nitrospiraceae bacterium]